MYIRFRGIRIGMGAGCLRTSSTLERILTCDSDRKHADRAAQVWMQKIKESSSNKKLSLIYLANGLPSQMPKLFASSQG